ncbi:MAG: dGTP triphosphohydrolase [Oscillospiraceae bacterium]
MLYWDKLLEPKRFRSTSSVFAAPSDKRSPFKKDFDTVCNSTILRRLQDKAQVFPLEQEDYARTRLTHSIEVLSIAESLGMQASKIILNNLDGHLSRNDYSEDELNRIKQSINDIPIILGTAALLHDMGNPPFGHLGEQIIGDWFRENLPRLVKKTDGTYAYKDGGDAENTLSYKLKGSLAEDLIHFDGNAQLLRLVTKLNYVVDENGMNLTFPVMATFIKYPCASTQINKATLSTKKVGYFTSESTQFNEITGALGLTGCRHPLAFLLEAADDIAYLSADIEDAQKKGIVSLDCLETYLKRNEKDVVVERVLEQIKCYKKEAKIIKYPNVDDYVIRRIRILIKGIMIDAMNDAFSNAYQDIMNGTCENELINLSSVATLAENLRSIERDKIYYCDSIVRSKTRAFRIIQKLLEAYVPAVLNYKDSDSGRDTAEHILYLSLSENYRFVCEQANKKTKDEAIKLYNRLLLVTDQISGMTDSRAMSIYQMITAI